MYEWFWIVCNAAGIIEKRIRLCVCQRVFQSERTGNMFQVKWRYEIRASAKLEFLGVYDRKGKWYDFFSKSRNYVGSNLTEESDNIFLLVDTWKSREAYYEFIDRKSVV